jgi:hypothetical protein
MEFALQTSNPRLAPVSRQRYADLAHAMQFIFPMATEDAILSFHHVPIRLSYKYDLAVLIDDLVPLLRSLLAEEAGSTVVKWASDTFRAHWGLGWSQDKLSIDAKWMRVSGGCEALLNQRGTLELPVASFIAEWRGVLWVIDDAVRRSAVALDDESILKDLRRVATASDERGQLYG